MFNKIIILFLFINCVYCLNLTVLNLKEGSKCSFNENITGTCVNFYKCTRLILDLPQKNYPPICSFDEAVPIVCCTSCNLVKNIDDAVTIGSGRIYWRLGRKSHDICLHYASHAVGNCPPRYKSFLSWNEKKKCHEARQYYVNKTNQPPTTNNNQPAIQIQARTKLTIQAIGINATTTGGMPHMALLGYGDDLEALHWTCGGSLISENFILTAAHCARNDLYGPVTYATLGFLIRDHPLQSWHLYSVKTIIVHPEYRPPVKYHDIALLETEDRVELSSQVIPGCLPGANQYVHDKASIKYKGQIAESTLSLTAVGWGALNSSKPYTFRRPMAYNLQNITVEAVNETECLELYPPHASIPHGYNKTTQLCFGNKYTHADTCEGDIGGPLQEKNLYCMYNILGVTSFGHACGFVGKARIYTRVAHYVPWIISIIWKDN